MSFLSPLPLIYKIGAGGVLLAAIAGYHYSAIWQADDAGYARAETKYKAMIEKSNADAQADHAAKQAMIDALSAVDNAATQKRFDAIQAQLHALRKTPVPKIEKVFPADCVAPKSAVEAANAGR